jgi:hypothetical protein
MGRLGLDANDGVDQYQYNACPTYVAFWSASVLGELAHDAHLG